MTLREAAQQALEAMEELHRTGDTQVFDLYYAPKVIPALRAALARDWQHLNDDEIKEIIGPWGDTPIKGYTRQLFDKIEAKIKEKNA